MKLAEFHVVKTRPGCILAPEPERSRIAYAKWEENHVVGMLKLRPGETIESGVKYRLVIEDIEVMGDKDGVITIIGSPRLTLEIVNAKEPKQ